jgi:uncharacterized membrane protein (DUF2068 family)
MTTEKLEAKSPKPAKGPVNRAPTLYAIIVFKILKGLLFATLAVTAYVLSDNNLPDEYKQLLHWLRFNPERKFWTDIAAQVATITEPKMVHAAVGTLIYSLFSLVEGIGLMFRISWAGWLSIGESSFFIPIELFELVKHPGLPLLGILVLNVFFVWYLFRNRDRLFHH